MKKILEFLKELIMKATRFILNTDYVTSQNDDEFTMSVTLPSSFSVSAGQVREFSTTLTREGTASKDYRCYFTSTATNYAVTGALEVWVEYGSDVLLGALRRAKDKWTFVVYNAAYPTAKTYSGTGQTITAHIQTFIDPFQV